MNNSLLICIMGVPGTGKTTLAQRLSLNLMTAPVLSTDTVKAFLEEKDDDPILSKVSHTVWELLGPFNNSTLIEGYTLFANRLFQGTMPLVRRLLATYRIIILEGMGVAPELISSQIPNRIDIILLQGKMPCFRNRKLVIRKAPMDHWSSKAEAINLIETHILAEARRFLPALVQGHTEDLANIETIVLDKAKEWLFYNRIRHPVYDIL